MTIQSENTSRLAWNGLSLMHPATWELAALGRERLQLARAGAMLLEVRWSRIIGRFSFDKHIRRLEKVHGRGRCRFQTSESAGWRPAQGLEARSFTWGRSSDSGMGALFFHPASSTAILAQYAGPARQAFAIFSSLRCHLADQGVPWFVYDLRAITPSNHELEEYSLQPGRYRLALRSGKQRIVLHRLAPADVLMAGRDLAAWSRDYFAEAIKRCRLMIEENEEIGAVTWRRPLSPAWTEQAAAKVLGKPVHCHIRAWRPPERNRILCVEAQGAQPLDEGMIAEVVNGYGTL